MDMDMDMDIDIDVDVNADVDPEIAALEAEASRIVRFSKPSLSRIFLFLSLFHVFGYFKPLQCRNVGVLRF